LLSGVQSGDVHLMMRGFLIVRNGSLLEVKSWRLENLRIVSL